MNASPFALFPSSGLSWRRTLGFVSLFERSVRSGWRSRLGRFYSYATAVGVGVVAVYLSRHGARSVIHPLFARGLAAISWASGIVALAASRDRDAEERASGVIELAEARGFDARALPVVRASAVATVLARAVGGPALLMALVDLFLAQSPRDVGLDLLLAVGVVAYAAVYGVVIAVLVHVALRATFRHANWVLAGLVLFPYLAHEAFGSVPNVVTAFEWLIGRAISLGGIAG